MTHPSGLTPGQVEEYLHRSYTRVDGLWFVIAEERHGFDAALALDEAVWKVLPKIQARLLQQQLGLDRDRGGLQRALQAKLTIDRYQFTFQEDPDGFTVVLTACPWHDLIVRSGREKVGERIGGVICNVEMPVFAKEFNCSCSPPSDQRICRNGAACRFRFQPSDEEHQR